MDIDQRLTARERLCAAATELFYAEGIHTVGIDRVIARAGVAKATLYNVFGSKNGLIKAYLLDRHELLTGCLSQAADGDGEPRERILAVFDVLGALISDPSYRGCPFMNATAESPEAEVNEVSDLHRQWVRRMFETLAEEAGAQDPERMAQQLVLLYDGVLAGSQMDRQHDTALAARDVAATILDAAMPR
jgi:AcrR family transcriptional regulator